MKAVRNIIIFLLLAGAGVYVWRLVRKAKHAKNLSLAIEGIRPSPGQALSVASLAGSIDIELDAVISNFSPSEYKLEQIYIEVFDKKGKTRVAAPTKPIKEAVIIKPNGQSKVSLSYRINTASALKTLFSQNVGELIKVLTGFAPATNYVSLKGFVRVEGLKVKISTTQTHEERKEVAA